jgi:hypothetical protein
MPPKRTVNHFRPVEVVWTAPSGAFPLQPKRAGVAENGRAVALQVLAEAQRLA